MSQDFVIYVFREALEKPQMLSCHKIKLKAACLRHAMAYRNARYTCKPLIGPSLITKRHNAIEPHERIYNPAIVLDDDLPASPHLNQDSAFAFIARLHTITSHGAITPCLKQPPTGPWRFLSATKHTFP